MTREILGFLPYPKKIKTVAGGCLASFMLLAKLAPLVIRERFTSLASEHRLLGRSLTFKLINSVSGSVGLIDRTLGTGFSHRLLTLLCLFRG